MSFGDRIKDLRKEKSWSQEYVAEKLHISIGALSRYENGLFEPKSLDLVKDFATLYETSTDYLLGNSDIREPIDIDKIQFANNNGLDTTGLDDDEVEELKKQVEYMKWKKQNKEGK